LRLLESRGDAKLTERLLKAGAKPGVANHDGATPLWLAAMRGDRVVRPDPTRGR
jgi:ankyrin repeat protein